MKDKRRLCEAAGCDRPHFAKGLCEKHHGRLHGTFCPRKLDAAQVREIRVLAGSKPKRELVKKFDMISRGYLDQVIKGRTWRYLSPVARNETAFRGIKPGRRY